MRREMSADRMGRGRQSAQFRSGYGVYGAGAVEGFVTSQYAVVYLLESVGEYTDWRGCRHPLAPGSVFQRFPGREHSLKIEKGGRRFWLAVPCQVAELLSLTGMLSYNRPVFDIGVDESVAEEFRQITHELKKSGESELPEIFKRMQDLIYSLHRLAGDAVIPGAQSSSAVRDAMQILSQDVGQRIKISEVSERVGMPYNSFRKAFYDEVGISPGSYRIRRRIERAMELLVRGMRLKKVAYELGYPDEYSFASQFKKISGQSPGEFRKIGV